MLVIRHLQRYTTFLLTTTNYKISQGRFMASTREKLLDAKHGSLEEKSVNLSWASAMLAWRAHSLYLYKLAAKRHSDINLYFF